MVEMNIRNWATVLSDLSGGEWHANHRGNPGGAAGSPYRLAALADPQVKATKEVIAKSLEANWSWREELLFVLRQELMLYRMYHQQIVECDQELESYLRNMEPKAGVDLQGLGPRAQREEGAGATPRSSICGQSCTGTTGI